MLSSERVRSALDSAPDTIVIADASGTIVFANHQVTGPVISDMRVRVIARDTISGQLRRSRYDLFDHAVALWLRPPEGPRHQRLP